MGDGNQETLSFVSRISGREATSMARGQISQRSQMKRTARDAAIRQGAKPRSDLQNELKLAAKRMQQRTVAKQVPGMRNLMQSVHSGCTARKTRTTINVNCRDDDSTPKGNKHEAGHATSTPIPAQKAKAKATAKTTAKAKTKAKAKTNGISSDVEVQPGTKALPVWKVQSARLPDIPLDVDVMASWNMHIQQSDDPKRDAERILVMHQRLGAQGYFRKPFALRASAPAFVSSV